jgi:hypothetical protein
VLLRGRGDGLSVGIVVALKSVFLAPEGRLSGATVQVSAWVISVKGLSEETCRTALAFPTGEDCLSDATEGALAQGLTSHSQPPRLPAAAGAATVLTGSDVVILQ